MSIADKKNDAARFLTVCVDFFDSNFVDTPRCLSLACFDGREDVVNDLKYFNFQIIDRGHPGKKVDIDLDYEVKLPKEADALNINFSKVILYFDCTCFNNCRYLISKPYISKRCVVLDGEQKQAPITVVPKDSCTSSLPIFGPSERTDNYPLEQGLNLFRRTEDR
jgi:hypothetical protein